VIEEIATLCCGEAVDNYADAAPECLAAAEIVGDHDIAFAQRRRQELLDIGANGWSFWMKLGPKRI
jgi:hypothetical protein